MLLLTPKKIFGSPDASGYSKTEVAGCILYKVIVMVPTFAFIEIGWKRKKELFCHIQTIQGLSAQRQTSQGHKRGVAITWSIFEIEAWDFAW